MIRAESPRNMPEESVPEQTEAIDETTRRSASPSPLPAENTLSDDPRGTLAAMTRSRPMHPDSARYTPQPTPPPSANGSATITCPQCGTMNLAAGGRRFCGDCGTNLWEKCHGCGSDVPVDERFCGQCGVNMTASVQQLVQTFQEQLAKAEQLEQEHRLSELKILLASLSQTQNPRLQDLAAKARQKLQHVRHEHDRWEHLAEAAHKRAQEAFALCNFDEAIRTLEEVPSPLRSTAMATMLQETCARKKEVEELGGRLREMLAQKRVNEVLPVLERLQHLQPDHPTARKIATSMRDQLVTKAKQRTAARSYDDALKLLNRIPSFVRTTESEMLLQEVDELSALWWDAHHCQYVDDALKEVLKRLLKRLPKDETIRKLATEYQKRRKRLDASERTAPLPWASTQETPWKCPIEWLVEPERIEMDDIAPSVRREYPGAFAVAFGLALQGIDQGPVRINFNEMTPGVMGRMAKLMKEKRHESAWGIDIGDHSLKAVKLVLLEGGKRVKAAECEVFPHRKLLSQAADYGEARDIVEETFDQFRGVHTLKGERLCLAQSARLTICRTLHLPAMPEKKVEEAIRFEVQHLLPGELDDYRWRRYRPDSSDDVAVEQSSHLLLALTRRHIDQTDETYERLGIRPDILQTEYLALHNYLGFEQAKAHQNGDAQRDAIVLLDMGAGGTSMIVQSPRCLWGKYLGVGGHTFSRALLREFQLTLQQADEWKRDPARADRWSRWESALGAVFDSFSKELSTALDAFAKDYPGEKIERILLTGGGTQIHGLLRYLRTGR